MISRIYAYARVSTVEQHLDRQIQAFKELGIDERNIITDKASGKDMDRKGYKALKDTMLRDGDTLVIKSLDRLSRNKEHIKQELEYFKTNHIRVKVIDLPTTMIDLPNSSTWVFDMINNILIEVLASIAEQERITIKQRQSEGIAAAKAKGKYLGRPKAEYPKEWQALYNEWINGMITANNAMERLQLKRTTFYKLVNQYQNKQDK